MEDMVIKYLNPTKIHRKRDSGKNNSKKSHSLPTEKIIMGIMLSNQVFISTRPLLCQLAQLKNSKSTSQKPSLP